MRRASWLALLAVVAACGEDPSAGAPPAVAAPAPGTLSDEWYLLRTGAHDVGYLRSLAIQRGEIVETTHEARMCVTKACVDVVHYEERATDGALLRVRAKAQRSAHEIEKDIRLEGGKAIFSTRVMGQTRESAIDVPSDLLGPERVRRLLTRGTGMKPGARVDTMTFYAEFNGPVTLEMSVVGDEEVQLLDGKKERLVRVETVFREVPLTQIAWFDGEGSARKIAWPGGAVHEAYLTTEQRARRVIEGLELPSTVFSPTLPAPHPIPCPRRLDRATYRIRAKGEMPAFADDRQSVEAAADGTVVLRVERKVPPKGRTGTRPIPAPPADLRSSLAPSSMVQSDAPEIVAFVSGVVGRERDAWRAAQGLERLVHENLRGTLEIDFASALEVFRDRQGDCSELAVLLCALCRAAGIPARCAAGPILHGIEWSAHMWTEVWIDGAWYPLDATLAQGSVDPAHITLARMTLEDTAFAEEYRGWAYLEIDATEVVLNGRAVRPGSDPARIEGRHYENALWGLGFECPEGWTFEATKPNGSLVWPLTRMRSGGGDSIEVGVLDTAPGGDWEQMRNAAGEENGGFEAIRVNGWAAFRVCDGRRVFALGVQGAFVFDLGGGPADTVAFEEFLATIDLDVK